MRKSNFELLRLICMFFVLVLHANFLSIGAPVYGKTPIGEFIIRIVIEVVPFLAVNVFILISGYFSIKPSLKSVVNILFCCLFYSVGIRVVYYAICWSTCNQPQFDFQGSFYFITNSVWFVTDYLMLMVFAPILNSFVDRVSNKMLITIVGFMFFFALYFGLYRGALIEYISGYSFVTFILLYLIGRALRQNKEWIEKHVGLLATWGGYLVGLFGLLSLVFLAGVKGHDYYFYLNELGTSRIFTYTHPFLILSAVCFFWLFARMNIYSPRVNKLARSVFAILLIHSNPVSITYYNKYFRFLYDHFELTLYLIVMLVSCITIFALSILVDQLRLFIYDKWISPLVIKIDDKLNKYEVI